MLELKVKPIFFKFRTYQIFKYVNVLFEFVRQLYSIHCFLFYGDPRSTENNMESIALGNNLYVFS